MKVVHINTEAHKGGAAVACNRIHEALSEQGIDSTVLNNERLNFVDRKRLFLNLALEKLLFTFYQKNSQVRFQFSIPYFGLNLSDYKLIKQADLIHLHWVSHGLVSIKTLHQLKKLNKPIVWTLHDQSPFTGGCHYSASCTHFEKNCGHCAFLKDPKPKDLSNQILLRKKAVYKDLNLTVVCCSHWLQGLAQSSSLFGDMPVCTIPNPIDTNGYKPMEKTSLKSQLGLDQNKFTLLFAAANVHDKRKGMQLLIEALEELFKKEPELKEKMELVVLGEVKGAALSLPMAPIFTGYIDDESSLARYYAAVDLFVSAAIEDNLPNTVMESLACGTAVLAFDVGGISDMIVHQKNGYLAKTVSSSALAEGLSWMYHHADPRSLQENARAGVLEKFEKEKIAKRYIDLYQETLTTNA